MEVNSLNCSQTVYVTSDGRKFEFTIKKYDEQQDKFEKSKNTKDEEKPSKKGVIAFVNDIIEKVGTALGMLQEEKPEEELLENRQKPKYDRIIYYRECSPYEEEAIQPFSFEPVNNIGIKQPRIIEFPEINTDMEIDEDEEVEISKNPVRNYFTNPQQMRRFDFLNKLNSEMRPDSSYKTANIIDNGFKTQISQSDKGIILNQDGKNLSLELVEDNQNKKNMHVKYVNENIGFGADIVLNENCKLTGFKAMGRFDGKTMINMMNNAVDLAREEFGQGFDYETAGKILQNVR